MIRTCSTTRFSDWLNTNVLGETTTSDWLDDSTRTLMGWAGFVATCTSMAIGRSPSRPVRLVGLNLSRLSMQVTCSRSLNGDVRGHWEHSEAPRTVVTWLGPHGLHSPAPAEGEKVPRIHRRHSEEPAGAYLR